MLRRLLYLLLFVVLVMVVALVALATPPGRNLVAGIIEKAAGGSGISVAIDGPSGWPPFSFGASKIVLSDTDGAFGEIDNAHVGVKVFALIGGKLAFSSIRADRIALSRRPHLPGGDGTSGAALPFAADSVSVARIDLAADVIGRPASLSLEGSLAAGRSGALSGHLDAERVDGVEGSLKASFARANSAAPFAVDVTAAEDADGILVGLLGRTAGPAYSLSAKTNVAGGAISGTVQLQSRGAAHFAGSFTSAPQSDGQIRVMAKADGDLAELVPADYADLLAGPIALDVDADWTPPAPGGLPAVAVRRGELSTANVHASLSGSLSDTTADLTLKADASKSGGGALALPFLGTGAAAQSLSVTGQVAPKGNVIRLDIVGRAADLTVAGNTLPAPDFSLAVEAPRSSPLAGGSVPFGLRAETDAIRTAGGQITASASAPIVINASGTFDTTTQSVTTNAKFAIGGSVGSFDGTVAGGTLKGKASADFADLSVLSPLAGRTLGGSLSASADGTLVGPQAAFKLTATARDLDVGEPAITRLLAGETQATAVVGIKGGAVTLDDVSVAGQAVTASGSASLAPDTVSASLSGGISDLGLVVDNSSGAATFQAMISGARQQPNVDATIAVASGHLAGKPVQDASIRFTGAPSAGGWQGALALGGQLASRPLSGTANAMLDSSGALSIPDINLAIGDNKITGALVRNPSGLLSGSLNIAANDVRTLAALFLIDASGTAGKVAVTLTPNSGKQSLHATFSGSQVAYQTAATQALSGDVSVADLFGAPVISGNITGSDIAVGDFHLASVKATATAEGGTTHFTAQAQNADLNLSGSGSFMPATDGSAITIDTLTGTAYRLPVQLASPVAINLGSQTSRLSGASLALGGGTVTADGTVSPNLNLTLAATNVSAAVANGFVAGLNAEGAVSGRATITGTPATPKFAWQVAWQGLRVAATRNAGLPPLAVNANGNGDGKGTSLSATIAGLPGLSLNANGTVPFSGSGLNLAVNGTAPLALLALQSSRELRLGGDARINLALTGALSAIATNGTIDLNGATIADTDTGFGVTGASGRIVFNGHQATTQQISGQMIQGGNITIAGSVTVDGPGLPANLTARVTNGRYADGRVINTTFSANLALNGPLLGAGTLSGTLDLGRTEIQLPDRLAGTATAIPVTHVNAPPGFRPPQLRQSEAAAGTTSAGGGGLVLDVTVNGGQTILVRGFGIDSEFGGSLKLTGTLGNPNTAGAFTMSRGRIEVLGRRFDFQSGTLTFSGNLIPILAFTGTTTTSDSTVTLTVSGPANDPKISFSSTPALPEEEILARLLFNQSVGKLSPLQAAQLVDAIAQLTGAAGNGGIFARIREATGLDDLDIRQTATGGTTVGLAKRINDNLQVGVEAGSDPDSSRVTIDLNLSKNLKARAAAGQGGTGEVGLTYEREY